MGRELVISEHAKQRMASRKISEEEALLAYKRPDYTNPGDYGATNFFKKIDGRMIRVTVGPHRDDKKKSVLITVVVQEPRAK